MAAAGALTKTTSAQFRLEGGTLAVGAASTWNGGDICVITGGVMRLDATLTIATGGGNFVCNSGNGQVQVAAGGRLLKDSPGTSTVSTLLDNDGTVQAGQGTLSVAAAPAVATDAGAFLADTGAELTLAGIRTVNGRDRRCRARPHDRQRHAAERRHARPRGTHARQRHAHARRRHAGHHAAARDAVGRDVQRRPQPHHRHAHRDVGHAVRRTYRDRHRRVHEGHRRPAAARGRISFRPQADSTWTGGDICVITSAAFRIEATFTIGTGAGNFVCNSGNGQIQIVSGGRLHKTSGGTSTVSTLLDNDGTVQASSGVLSLAAGTGTDAGTFLATPSSPSPASARRPAGSGAPARPHHRERHPARRRDARPRRADRSTAARSRSTAPRPRRRSRS